MIKKLLLSSFFLSLTLFSQDIDYSRIRNSPAISGSGGAGLIGFQPTGGTVPTTVAAALNSAFLYSTGYSTLALACSAANSANKTLALVNTFANSPTQALNCDIWFPSGTGAMFQPASAAAITMAQGRTITAAAFKIFDYSLGGTVNISNAKLTHPAPVQWWGVKGDDSTDNSTAMGYANTASRSLYWPAGVYRYSTSPGIRAGATWTCENNNNSIFRATGTHGLQFTPDPISNRIDARISNCGFMADGVTTQDAIYANNVYGLYLDNPKAGYGPTFGLTAISANSASVGYFVIDNTGTGNSAFITIVQPVVGGGSGSAIVAHTDTGNGVAGLNIIGGELHEVDRYAIEATGSGYGAHEIHATGGVYEGTGLGFLRLNWLTASYFTGIHFENGATAVVPVQFSNGGVLSGVTFSNNNIGCGVFGGVHAASGVGFGGTSSIGVTIENNVFTNCDVAVTLNSGAKNGFRLSSNRLVNTPKLYDYDSLSTNVVNLCLADATLGNGCFSTQGTTPPLTQIGALNYISTESGAANAIKGTLTLVSQLSGPGFNEFTDGMTVTVKLAHTLQAGANTFDLNPVVSAGPRAIKSRRDPAANIAVAYAATGYVTLMWNSTANCWMDVSQ